MAGNRFRLQGGLGNQLFIYYAAASYAIANKQEVITFDTSGLRLANTERALELDKFNLPIEYEIVVSRIPHVARAILTRMNRLIPAVNRRIGYFQPTDVGFSETLLKKTYFEVSGYFQSWRYHESVKKTFPGYSLDPGVSCDWAKSKISVAKASKPILCHIRRGDFLELQDSFGVLSYEYYITAINQLRSMGAKGPIWVMTDSPNEISLDFLQQVGAELVIEPTNTIPTDTFAVMQACDSYIISNSTFSWWAAYTSNAKVVISPKPWFKSMQEPLDLIPENWIRIQSSWI
ncbi:MAG: alpha-1,2-fucosyltransferase [Candidatus Planktophila sp.]